VFFGIFIFLADVSAQKDKPKTIRLPAVLNEVSGLWIKGVDSLWWHNDGGHTPTLYCTDRNGNLLDTIAFKSIRNIDWEDLTADDRGHIYIGDFGNNLNRRKNLKIYIYQRATGNLEAFFYHQDSLHLFSKNKAKYGNYQTRHYVLPAKPGVYSIAAIDSLLIKRKIITGACISPDGKTVAMTAYNYGRFLGIFPWVKNKVFLFSNFKNNRFLRGRMRKRKAPGFIFPKQYEALDFLDNKTLYLATERIFFFKQKAKRFKLKR